MDIGRQRRVIVVEPLRLDDGPPTGDDAPDGEPTGAGERAGAGGMPETVPAPVDETD